MKLLSLLFVAASGLLAQQPPLISILYSSDGGITWTYRRMAIAPPLTFTVSSTGDATLGVTLPSTGASSKPFFPVWTPNNPAVTFGVASLASPAIFTIGSVSTRLLSPPALTVTAGNGVLFAYIDGLSGNFTAGTADASVTFTGSGVAPMKLAFDQFPVPSIPVATITVTNGTVQQVTDFEGSMFLASPLISGGAGIGMNQTPTGLTLTLAPATQ